MSVSGVVSIPIPVKTFDSNSGSDSSLFKKTDAHKFRMEYLDVWLCVCMTPALLNENDHIFLNDWSKTLLGPMAHNPEDRLRLIHFQSFGGHWTDFTNNAGKIQLSTSLIFFFFFFEKVQMERKLHY